MKDYNHMKYCCKCPRFRMHFAFIKNETEKSCYNGCLFCECCDKDEDNYTGGTSMEFYGLRISDSIRRRLVFSGSKFGNIIFLCDEIPSELLKIAQRYMEFRDCPLLISDKNCEFHVERNLEEWSEDEEEWSEDEEE